MLTLIGCVSDTKVDPCAIPIRDREEVVNQYFQKYNAWRLGDDFLDWYGAEQGQGTFLGNVAEGSPGIWTSNNPADPGYQPINTCVSLFFVFVFFCKITSF